MTALGWLILIIALVIITSIALYVVRSVLHKKGEKAYEHEIYRITIPQYAEVSKQQQENYKERLSQVENLFAALASVKAERGLHSFFYGRNDHFSLEMVTQNDAISLYASLPRNLSEFFIQQVQTVYPHAHFDPVLDYNIFQPQAAILGGYLIQRRSFIFPIKTFKFFDSDPLEGLTSALSKLPKDSGAAIQLIARSAEKGWHQDGRKVTTALSKGVSLADAIKQQGKGSGGGANVLKILTALASILGASFSSKQRKPDERNEPLPQQSLSARDQETVRGIEEKISKGGFDTNIRIVVSAPDAQRAETHLKNIMNSFGQYNIYEFGNAFKPAYLGSQEKIIRNFIYRHFESRAAMLLGTEEVTSLFHLPENIKAPNLKWLKAKKTPPPVEIPEEGIMLGRSTYRGKTIDIRMKDADRRRHVYVIGQTGTGKSKLLEYMAYQDIRRGKGVCVIDPHGDLVEDILKNVPKDRAQDVIIFDPSDTDRPLALNMLEFSNPEQKSFAINEMINIFDKLYDLRSTGGPMFEQYMRNTMLLMMEDPESGSTLLEIPRVLSDEKFRRYKLSRTQNHVVKDFWEKEAQKAGGEAALANMVPYITSKLTQFVANDIMRPIISQQESSFNFRTVMDEQKILLINLSKGKIGDMNSSLLGMICVGKLLMAALSRVDTDTEHRKDFYLYIDEFQNYVSESIAIILSEARKYRLNLTLAHQYIGQLVKNNNTNVRDAVFGNVGTMAAFRVGVEDAETIAQQFAPVLDQYDVMNIETYNCYVRLLVDNQNPPAFNMSTELPPAGSPQTIPILKDMSRMKYGRPREVIKQEILERTKAAFVPPKDHLPPLR